MYPSHLFIPFVFILTPSPLFPIALLPIYINATCTLPPSFPFLSLPSSQLLPPTQFLPQKFPTTKSIHSPTQLHINHTQTTSPPKMPSITSIHLALFGGTPDRQKRAWTRKPTRPKPAPTQREPSQSHSSSPPNLRKASRNDADEAGPDDDFRADIEEQRFTHTPRDRRRRRELVSRGNGSGPALSGSSSFSSSSSSLSRSCNFQSPRHKYRNGERGSLLSQSQSHSNSRTSGDEYLMKVNGSSRYRPAQPIALGRQPAAAVGDAEARVEGRARAGKLQIVGGNRWGEDGRGKRGGRGGR